MSFQRRTARVVRRDHHGDLVMADGRDEREQLLDRRITDGEAADRDGPAMDEDIAVESCKVVE